MKKADVKVGGVYWARISGKLTKVRLDQEIERRGYGPRAKTMTGYAATNLGTGRKITIKSAAKLQKAAFHGGLGVFNMEPKGEEHADVGQERAAEGQEITFLAVAFGSWGRGDTEADAVAQCRKAGANRRDKTVIYRNTRPAGKDKPYVDEAGNTAFFGTLDKIAVIENGKRLASDPNLN